MNIWGQTGLDLSKQVQIEHFLKFYKIDILNCQEINILKDSFSYSNYISSSYQLLSNNACNKYGTCSLVSNSLHLDNIKLDTNGRVILYNIGDTTFGNVYLPSGNSPTMRNNRENYSAETLPQLLVNCKDNGAIGGDWNSIVNDCDATKNQAQKKSPALKRLIKTFSWYDSFRQLHPKAKIFSRYYEHNDQSEGATRIDRQYNWGNISIIETKYVGVAFSDHQALIVKLKLPESQVKFLGPRSRPLFKAKPEVVRDEIFYERLKFNFISWSEIRKAGLDIMSWWELIVKPGIRRLLIERGKEMNTERSGQLNLLFLRQAYLVRKLQSGEQGRLSELKSIHLKLQFFYAHKSEKIRLPSKANGINSSENVRVYHHELHVKHIHK